MRAALEGEQRKIYDLLAGGAKLSVADISTVTRYCDPRSIIRNMRKKGVKISDEWRQGFKGIKRHKVYFLHEV